MRRPILSNLLNFLSRIVLLAGVVLSVSLYGCGNRLSEEVVQPTTIKNDKRVDQSRTGFKPGASVILKDTKPLYAATPGIYEYSIVLLSSYVSGEMIVDISTSDDISFLSSNRHFEFSMQPQAEYKVPLTLDVNKEGRFYIQLHVSITADGQHATRAIAVILQVGEPELKAQKMTSKSAAGESDSIITLPAQETISPR